MAANLFKTFVFLIVFAALSSFIGYTLIGPTQKSFANRKSSIIDLTAANSCNVFESKKQSRVLIDGEIYPKHVPLHHNNSINFACLNQSRNIGNKRILLWNSFHGEPLKNDLFKLIHVSKSSEVFDLLRCPVNNCELTLKRSKLNESSLVLFHLRAEIYQWPAYRPENQRWVCNFLSNQNYF